MEASVEKLFGEAILDEAARRFGMTAGSYKMLGDFENYVYEMNRGGEAYIMRLTHSSHRLEGEISAELAWISFLVSEGLDIPACFPSLQGSLTERIPAGDSWFTACLFQKAKGNPPDVHDPAVWNPELFEHWGEIIGRMHEATSRYEVPAGSPRRPDWEDDELLRDAANYTVPGDEFVLERLDQLLAHLRGLPREKNAYGLIHTDIHRGNFFVKDGRIAVFDFDDCAYNWFVHDIAIPLYYSLTMDVPESYAGGKEAFALDFLRAFRKGYRSAYELPSEWLKEMPYFLKLRDITLYLVINKKLDPANRKPHIQQWMEDIKDRIRRDVPVVEVDYGHI